MVIAENTERALELRTSILCFVPPTRPALRARYDRRRAEVVNAAARVFAERGYEATTMDDLSEATGLAAGGLYHYIGSKEQLLFDICAELLDPLLADARAIVAEGAPPEETLRRLVRVWVDHVERHRDHMRVFQQERQLIERGPRWRAVRGSRKKFERVLEGVLEAGGFVHPDRRIALEALLAMINALPQWFRPRGRLTPDQVAEGFCDLLLHGAARR
jgi:TetR/AcrR family transcriptional regulator, cholesterol catabolism regulator